MSKVHKERWVDMIGYRTLCGMKWNAVDCTGLWRAVTCKRCLALKKVRNAKKGK